MNGATDWESEPYDAAGCSTPGKLEAPAGISHIRVVSGDYFDGIVKLDVSAKDWAEIWRRLGFEE